MGFDMQHKCRNTYIIGFLIFLTLGAATFVHSEEEPELVEAHTHIESLGRAEVLLKADENVGISKTMLMPSPNETLTLNGRKSFTLYRPNVSTILEIAEKYPDKFVPFCTVSPLDDDALQYVRECVKRGARGLKLYNGHSYYYEIFQMPLDDPVMMEIYDFAEETGLPLLFHVNLSKYEAELRRVLDAHPDLVVSVPHFMVSSRDLERVAKMLDDYPNLYTDVSFGSPEFMAAGFRRISNDPGRFSDFIQRYADRVLFGADMVLTETGHKDQNFMETVLRCYRNLLEAKTFQCQPVQDYYSGVRDDQKQIYENCRPKEGDYCQSLKHTLDVYEERVEQTEILSGLNLSPSVLKKIYQSNPEQYLEGVGNS